MAEQNKERRNGPDFWVYSIRLLAVSGWLLLLFAIVLSYYAAPETEYAITRYHNIEVRKSWRVPLTYYLYLILWFNAATSLLCIIIAHFRERRISDTNNFNRILLLLTSIGWVAYIFVDMK